MDPIATATRDVAARPAATSARATSAPPASDLLNAFTVDVEDYFHVSGFADRIRPADWDHYSSRVVPSTHRILRLLERHSTRATFFVLGWVARKFPELVFAIHRDGHEIGCHSDLHRLVYDLTPDEFQRDTADARDVLQEIIGDPVTAYRAPSFSITQRSLWALPILRAEGFTLDASIYPVQHDRYGMPDADPAIHRIETPAGPITECPSPVCRIAGRNVPVGGGGYFRLYPYRLTRTLLRRINRTEERPFVFYVHPWEVDPEQPRLPGKPLARFRHTVNLHRTEDRIDRLLQDFRFDTLSAVVNALKGHESRRPIPIQKYEAQSTPDPTSLVPVVET